MGRSGRGQAALFRPSHAALWLAARLPLLARAATLAWGWIWWVFRARPHWLLRRLKSVLGIRFHRRVRLYTGQPVYVDPLDVVGGEIARCGMYEPDTVRLLEALLKPGMVMFDVGAHVGQYTLMASLRVGPFGEVHAFEPDPQTFECLTRNIGVNRCRNVRAVQEALGDENTWAPLYLGDVNNWGAASLQPRRAPPRVTQVRVEMLDDYAEHAGLGQLDVLKADVEGAELPLLLGAQRALARFSPVLVLELSVKSSGFNYTPDDLVAWLHGHCYRVYRVDRLPCLGYEPRPAEAPFFNVLAVPPRIYSDLLRRGVIEPLPQPMPRWMEHDAKSVSRRSRASKG